MSSLTSTPPDSTLILGGGIIGLSTAYYLSLGQPNPASASKIHIIDTAPSLLLSASGFAGGFVAKDWFSPPTASLGALSFRLHKELADAHNGARRWGYSRATAYSLSIDEKGVSGRAIRENFRKGQVSGDEWLTEGNSRAEVAGMDNDDKEVESIPRGEGAERDEMLNDDGTPAWLTKQDGGSLEVIADEGCAQVEPKELCEFLLEEIQKKGVKVHLSSRATRLLQDDSGEITGMTIQNENGETTMNCKSIVITSGAWSSSVFKTLFPSSKTKLGIGPLAGYSMVIRSPRLSKPIIDPAKHTHSMCHSIFCAPGPNWPYAPEVFSRTTKSGRPEIYIAGLNDTNMALPPDAVAVEAMVDSSKVSDLRRTMVHLTGLSQEGDNLIDDDLEVVRIGLCLRPLSHSGKPIITKLDPTQLGPGIKPATDGGVFVAAGHGPWGISLSLGTGQVMSELILHAPTPSADITSLGLS